MDISTCNRLLLLNDDDDGQREEDDDDDNEDDDDDDDDDEDYDEIPLCRFLGTTSRTQTRDSIVVNPLNTKPESSPNPFLRKRKPSTQQPKPCPETLARKPRTQHIQPRTLSPKDSSRNRIHPNDKRPRP